MQAKIDMDELWRSAQLKTDADLTDEDDGLLPDLPAESPFSPDDLIGEGFDFERAVACIAKGD